MNPSSGRVYYPTKERYGNVGLVASKLSIELSKHFLFDSQTKSDNHQFDEPYAIEWQNKTYELSKLLKPILINHRLPGDED